MNEVFTLRAVHQIVHDRVPILPGSIFDATRETAEYLIEHGAAQLASEPVFVPIEDKAPPGKTALNKIPGQPSSVFVDTAELEAQKVKSAGNY
jgi:hypothetical protein